MTEPQLDVELLLVPDCPHASAAQALLRSALDATGLVTTPIRISVIDSEGEAADRGFLGSPTIRINGIDPFAEPGRPIGMACRIYPGPAGASGLPAAAELRKALQAVRHQVDR
jgi:hypothetical protein